MLTACSASCEPPPRSRASTTSRPAWWCLASRPSWCVRGPCAACPGSHAPRRRPPHPLRRRHRPLRHRSPMHPLPPPPPPPVLSPLHHLRQHHLSALRHPLPLRLHPHRLPSHPPPPPPLHPPMSLRLLPRPPSKRLCVARRLPPAGAVRPWPCAPQLLPAAAAPLNLRRRLTRSRAASGPGLPHLHAPPRVAASLAALPPALPPRARTCSHPSHHVLPAAWRACLRAGSHACTRVCGAASLAYGRAAMFLLSTLRALGCPYGVARPCACDCVLVLCACPLASRLVVFSGWLRWCFLLLSGLWLCCMSSPALCVPVHSCMDVCSLCFLLGGCQISLCGVCFAPFCTCMVWV